MLFWYLVIQPDHFRKGSIASTVGVGLRRGRWLFDLARPFLSPRVLSLSGLKLGLKISFPFRAFLSRSRRVRGRGANSSRRGLSARREGMVAISASVHPTMASRVTAVPLGSCSCSGAANTGATVQRFLHRVAADAGDEALV